MEKMSGIENADSNIIKRIIRMVDHGEAYDDFKNQLMVFNEELKRVYGKSALLDVPAWHYMVGSSPGMEGETDGPETPIEVKEEITRQVHEFIRAIEEKWGLTEGAN